MKTLLLTLALALTASAQTPTEYKHLSGFGAALDNGHLSAVTANCTLLFAKNYGCIATSNNGKQSSTRAGLERKAFGVGPVSVMVLGNYGVASGGNGSVGGSFDVGGAIPVSLDKLLPNQPGWFIAFVGSASKSNVSQFVQSNHGVADFKALGLTSFIGVTLLKGW